MSVSAVVPSFYKYALTYLDPIVTAWAAYMDFAMPQTVVDSFIPNTPRNQDLDMFFQQTAGYMLGLSFLQTVLLRSTDELKIWRVLQNATLIIDAAHLYSLYWGLSRQGRLDPGVWRGEDWGCVLITVIATAYRLAFVLGVGFRTAAADGNKNVKSHSS